MDQDVKVQIVLDGVSIEHRCTGHLCVISADEMFCDDGGSANYAFRNRNFPGGRNDESR